MAVDANAPVLRVIAAPNFDTTDDATAAAVTAELEVYDAAANWVRNVSRPYAHLASSDGYNTSAGNPNAFGSYCLERFLEPDTVVDQDSLPVALQDRVVWYHRNEDTMASHGVPSYFDNVMRSQGLDPAAFDDPLLHRTFGGAMGGHSWTKTSDTKLSGALVSAKPLVLEVTLSTVARCSSSELWLSAMATAVRAEAARGTLASKQAAHNATWMDLWNRSHIEVSVPAGSRDEGAESRTGLSSFATLSDPQNVKAVNDAYVWQRYLDICDGRNSWGLIKFNGQAFTVSQNGTFGGRRKGICAADYRDWGPSNWIQNSR
eukprot:SAG31_NODE_8309_length_1477_cov_1.000726_2_plen_317_part_01